MKQIRKGLRLPEISCTWAPFNVSSNSEGSLSVLFESHLQHDTSLFDPHQPLLSNCIVSQPANC